MSEPKEIPAAMLDAAAEAMLFYPHDGNYTRLAKAALEAARVPELLAQIADYGESYRRVIVEQCAIDEKHCTCVPALRARIARLEREVSFRKEAWDGADSHVTELQARIAKLEAALHKVVHSQDVAMPIELDEEITKLLSAESVEVSECQENHRN